MKNNAQVETTQKSQATNKNTQSKNTKKSNVPTGKVVLMKDTEARKKAREEEYKNFRINALRRRCERLKMSEEDTEKAVKRLLEQLKLPNMYTILMLFNKQNADLVKQALKEADLSYDVMSKEHCIVIGEQDVLDELRKIMPTGTRICPYVRKRPPIIENKVKPKPKPKVKSTPHSVAKGANVKKKRVNVAAMSKIQRKKFKEQVKSLRDKWASEKREKKRTGTTVQMKPKKAATGKEKAPMTMKKAA